MQPLITKKYWSSDNFYGTKPTKDLPYTLRLKRTLTACDLSRSTNNAREGQLLIVIIQTSSLALDSSIGNGRFKLIGFGAEYSNPEQAYQVTKQPLYRTSKQPQIRYSASR